MNPDTPGPAAPAPRRGFLLLGIFLVSVATLHLEILQTRIFSVLLWHHVTYLVVTFTLLGFAASGTFLALFPGLLGNRPMRFLSVCALLFALTTHAAFQILGRSELDTLSLLSERVQYLYVFVYYLYLVVPYFLAGLVIVGGLKIAGRGTGALYAANLAGSAGGCLLFATVLTWLGGEGSVFLGAGLAALSATAFALASHRPAVRKGVGVLSALVGVVSLGLMPFADSLLPIQAAPSKVMMQRIRYAEERGHEPEILATRWDPLCRIDVLDLEERTQYPVFQDADAPTTIVSADFEPIPLHIYGFPYLLAPKNPNTLVVGVGGGQDLLYALHGGSRQVTGVEINRSTASLMRNEFAEYSGNLYTRDRVQVFETEGRSFIRRSEDKYDNIQMTGTDTYAALSSGSYVLSESYLYTTEAFDDYFDHLTDGGFVSVLRFRFFPPRESLRLVAIAVEAMRQRGIQNPERHVVVMGYYVKLPLPDQPGKVVDFPYAVMMFKKTPLTPEQIETARRFGDEHPRGDRYELVYAPGIPKDNEFSHYFEAVASGTEAEFMADYPYRITTVSDDSPFFFNFHRWGNLFKDKGEEPERADDSTYFRAIGDDPVGLMLLGTALLESTVLVALLVVLPLLFSRRLRMPSRGRGGVFWYFLGLGVGFLFLEIACMQRLSLYLGHPTRSITVVLFSFLLFSGLGSAVAGKIGGATVGRVALALITILVAVYAVFLPDVLDATLGQSTTVRIAIATGLLALPAFFMGMPFPAGLSRLQGDGLPFLPWAFAINGGASVIASVAAIFLAMGLGFTAVFWLAFACYAVSFIAAPRLPRAADAR